MNNLVSPPPVGPTFPRPYHVEHLRASGLTDATIAERGYTTAMFKTDLTAAGFSLGQARNVPALLIPIYDVAGSLHLYQMRPDTAPVGLDGKPYKYMTPKEEKLCLDVPRSVQPLLSDPSVPLWITEGSKKVDAAVQHGLCCIGALGVTGWMRDHAPLPDWQQIALQGRTVYIAFDADARQKRPVWMALQALQTFLEGQGARPLIVYLPDDANTPDKKIGLDDFLANGGTPDALRALASDTLCPCPSGANAAPRNDLEKLRVNALTVKLRGVADVHAHGGLLVSKEATLQELAKAAHNVCYFYGRIDDLKKWDLIDLWMAIEPHVPAREIGVWKQQHFGRYAAQLSNWISKVGAFARNPVLRRPHLPFWLHEYLRDLTPEQQTTVFDTFEAEGRLSQADVQRMIDDLNGPQEPKDYEPPIGMTSANSSLTGGHWQRLAQHLPEAVAEAGLRLLRECGPQRAAAVLLAAVETELSRDDQPDVWDGYDVSDTPPQNDDAENDVFAPVKNNEIETRRQTRRQSFTGVKELLESEGLEARNYTLPMLPKEADSEPIFHAVIEGEGEKTSSITGTHENQEATYANRIARRPALDAADSPAGRELSPYADLLARAQAGTLPLLDAPLVLNAYTKVHDLNKAVVSFHTRQDTDTLEKIAQALQE